MISGYYRLTTWFMKWNGRINGLKRLASRNKPGRLLICRSIHNLVHLHNKSSMTFSRMRGIKFSEPWPKGLRGLPCDEGKNRGIRNSWEFILAHIILKRRFISLISCEISLRLFDIPLKNAFTVSPQIAF